MAHTFTETVGVIQAVVAYMENPNNTAALGAKNSDVAPHLAHWKGKLASINHPVAADFLGE